MGDKISGTPNVLLVLLFILFFVYVTIFFRVTNFRCHCFLTLRHLHVFGLLRVVIIRQVESRVAEEFSLYARGLEVFVRHGAVALLSSR
jgi:hypothetical protein